MSSGSGDVGGEVSGEEAAWRDLIARFDMPGANSAVSVPWPAVEDLPDSSPVPAEQPEVPEAPARRIPDDLGPADRTRVIRHAGDPRSYSAPEEEDERYVPEPLPPPAQLDGLSKAAWAALICGPGYLLFGTIIGWTISGTDRPRRDDNDDGAVL
jgi:hypothetical protein